MENSMLGLRRACAKGLRGEGGSELNGWIRQAVRVAKKRVLLKDGRDGEGQDPI